VRRVLIANKSDLAGRRKVSADEADALAKRHNMPYYEVSARDSTNVHKAFESITKAVAETHKLEMAISSRARSSMGSSRYSGDHSGNPKCC
jgi:GTPase SAR1 family protein